VKNFDEMLSQDRDFTVAGETFQWRNVRPEVLTSFEQSDDKDADADAAWRLMDDQILLFLHKNDHDRWRELRAREENPVTIAQLNAILLWLMEEQTGRPTVPSSPSDPGRGRTAATSKAA
jgi:hypothetical protein